MAESVSTGFNRLDRQVGAVLRAFDVDKLTKSDKLALQDSKKALTTLRLDIRDYEYAETRDVQLKWAKIAKHNLVALESNIKHLSSLMSAADFVDIAAHIDLVRERII